MGPPYGVRAVFDGYQPGAFDEFGRPEAGGLHGHNSIGLAVNDQGGDVDPFQVRAEVFMPRGDAGETGNRRGARGYVPTRLDGLLADAFPEQNIGVVEVLEEFRKEGISIRGSRLLNARADGGI